MPVKYIVMDSGRLVIEKWVGRISHAELIDHEKQQLNDTSIAPGAVALVEAREATYPETSLGLVHELADVHSNPGNKTSISRYALLVSDETYEQAKVFEQEARKHGVTIITFNWLSTACTWLGIDAKTVEEKIKSIVIEWRPAPRSASREESSQAEGQ
jgi:hypothetical protein